MCRLRLFLLFTLFLVSCGSPETESNLSSESSWQPAKGSLVWEGKRFDAQNRMVRRMYYLKGDTRGALAQACNYDGNPCVEHWSEEDDRMIPYISRAMVNAKYKVTKGSSNCVEDFLEQVTAKGGQFLLREERCQGGVHTLKELSNAEAHAVMLWAGTVPR